MKKFGLSLLYIASYWGIFIFIYFLSSGAPAKLNYSVISAFFGVLWITAYFNKIYWNTIIISVITQTVIILIYFAFFNNHPKRMPIDFAHYFTWFFILFWAVYFAVPLCLNKLIKYLLYTVARKKKMSKNENNIFTRNH